MVTLMILGIVIFATQVEIAKGETRLGLHVTQEELNVWRQRAATGPYRLKSDVSPNSPADWTRISKNATAFLANPSAERWSGQVSASCRTNSSSQPSRTKGEKLRDAAFVYLLQGITSYRDAVRHELLSQAASTGTKFHDSSRWCVDGPVSEEALIDVAPWLARLLFAYDWIRGSLSSSDRAILDGWFLAGGLHFESIVHKNTSRRWPLRKVNDYASSPLKYTGVPSHNIYYGGPRIDSWHMAWNNISAGVVRTFGLIGIQQNNPTLKSEAKRWFKEWLKYSVWHTNTQNKATHGEYHRCCWESVTHFPSLGWGYASSTIAAMTTLADAFHRAGDSELFTYSTSEGYYGTNGGPKSLHSVITTHFQMMDHTILRYGTSDANNVGNPRFLLDNVDENSGWHHIGDVWIGAIANRFYKSSYFKSIFLRTAPGVPAYPSVPASGGNDPWSGNQGIFPGVLFMFGNMETTPVPPSTPLASPSGLSITVK